MRIHFDLGGITPYFRPRWETRLAAWFSAAPTALTATDSPEDADAILALARTRHWGRLGHGGLDEFFPRKTFVWDSSDFPSGRIAGLYCGLPRELHETGRHRTFCYPFRWNDHVSPSPPEAAVHLAGFLGAITSPLRDRLVSRFARAPGFSVRVADSLWTQMDDPASQNAKRAYADHLRECRFILCPRGNGVSSVRLFETMEAGRVPVILSDRFVPPADPAWRDCVIHVPEARLADLPTILREADRDWPTRAALARSYWENNYSDGAVLPRLASLLGELLDTARPPGWGHRVRFVRYAVRHLSRDASRRLRGLVS